MAHSDRPWSLSETAMRIEFLWLGLVVVAQRTCGFFSASVGQMLANVSSVEEYLSLNKHQRRFRYFGCVTLL